MPRFIGITLSNVCSENIDHRLTCDHCLVGLPLSTCHVYHVLSSNHVVTVYWLVLAEVEDRV